MREAKAFGLWAAVCACSALGLKLLFFLKIGENTGMKKLLLMVCSFGGETCSRVWQF